MNNNNQNNYERENLQADKGGLFNPNQKPNEQQNEQPTSLNHSSMHFVPKEERNEQSQNVFIPKNERQEETQQPNHQQQENVFIPKNERQEKSSLNGPDMDSNNSGGLNKDIFKNKTLWIVVGVGVGGFGLLGMLSLAFLSFSGAGA